MNYKKLLIIFLVMLNIGLLFAQSNWIAKIDGEKISLDEFNEMYRAAILVSLLNSPVPIAQSDIDKLYNDKERRKLFLRNLEAKYLIMKVSKEKGYYSDSKIEKDMKGLSKLFRQQLILKEFYQKHIFPKVNVSSSEINTAYKDQKKKGRIPKTMKEDQAKKIIENQLKAQKAQQKLQDETEKLRLESKIIHNESVLD